MVMQIVTQEEDIPAEAMTALGISRKVDQLEAKMKAMPPADCPTNHVFTKGLYTRTIFMPAGTLIVSKIHKTQHTFFVLQGTALVWTEKAGVVEIAAPFVGVTEPGTRRVLYIKEDSVWATAHANPDDENLEQIEARIIEPHDISYLEEPKAEEVCNAA